MANKKCRLTTEEVKRIAALANLTLTPSEIKKFRQQLSQTIDFIKSVNKILTEGLEPTSHVTGQENVFREDVVKTSLTQKEALCQAKSTANGYFRSPKVF
jgi:aspartyl-tRNA(Asn)/glutamyl-tRNA(Gln) amidotransferase subunit C